MHPLPRTAAVAATVVALAAAACSPARSGARTPAPSTPTPSAATTSASPTPDGLRGKVVVVDPGHNGGNASHPRRINERVDAGGFRKQCNTTGTETDDGYPEHAYNWDVAKRLTKLLRAEGAKVVLTRKSDDGVGPCIDERGRTAARHDADLLVSVHADGSLGGGHGFAVLRPGKVPGYTARTYGRSKLLARDVADAFVDGGFTPSTYLGRGGIDKRKDLGTLNLAGVPAVMVETGNMRSPQDARVLSRGKGRQRVAKALAAGVAAYTRRA